MPSDLSSGLLTEVQCQSKRLRKGGKARGQEEEEQADSRRVSSSSRLPAQVRKLAGLGISQFLGASEEQTRKTEAKGMLLLHSCSFYKPHLIRMTGSVGWGCWSLSQWSLRERRECSLDIVHYCVAGYSLIYLIFEKCLRCVHDASVSRLGTLKPPQNRMIGLLQRGKDCPESSVVETSHDRQYVRTRFHYCILVVLVVILL